MGSYRVDLDAILSKALEALSPLVAPLSEACGHEISLVVDDLEWEAWPQTWGDTSLGYGGMGGQLMTCAQTVVVSAPMFITQVAVFFGGPRLAYIADTKSSGWAKAYLDRRLPGKWESGKVRSRKS